MITWQKQGVLFSAGEARAQSPTAILLGRIIRIYYSSRIDGKSHIFYIDVDAETMDIAKYCATPVLSPGEPGSFDENGCVSGDVSIPLNGTMVLSYTGFSAGENGSPYNLNVGQAVSEDGGKTFKKREKLVIRGACTPHCIDAEPGELYPYFVSRIIDWRNGTLIYRIPNIPSNGDYESTARPAIVKLGNKYCMWFSYRQAEDFRGGKGSYRMGYAESPDLKTWQRDDSKAGIGVGEPGEFDSEMQCYPSIVRVKNHLVMFYNGNGFGETGIGCATAEL